MDATWFSSSLWRKQRLNELRISKVLLAMAGAGGLLGVTWAPYLSARLLAGIMATLLFIARLPHWLIARQVRP